MFKKFERPRLLWGSIALIILAVELTLVGFTDTNSGKMKFAEKLPVKDELSSLVNADIWINSESLSAAKLKGKVVLINFCTYTCINWLRTLPYVRAWAKKYKDQGLVVIGVHTPEFSFEKNVENVRRYVKEMNIEYPIATDNNYKIWNAFDNHYWPALYFIDGNGKIRYQKFGEGDYEQSEKMIQQLVREAGFTEFNQEFVGFNSTGIEASADWKNLGSPENYLGYTRTQNFASPENALLEKDREYSAPARLDLNSWSLSGNWTIGHEAVVLNKANGRIVYRFHARDLHLVMGGSTGNTAIRFRVRIDEHAPGAAHGTDIDEEGNGIIKGQRLYQLIRQTGSVVDRVFEIEFLDAGAEAFAFTFG